MWNFGIPSVLKAWIDLAVRPGRTFRYTKVGVSVWRTTRRPYWFWLRVVSLRKAMASVDFVEPYLRQILGFIGIVNVQTAFESKG
jgi:FMN-dependent NADH-azoreductase